MESDCVSLHTSESLALSDMSDSSVLSTPELTPPSSSISCDGSENSFFSARTSNSGPILPAVVVKLQDPDVGALISEVPIDGRVQFPSKVSDNGGIPPSPPPIHELVTPPTTPLPRRPRKLRKVRPHVPKLSLDSALPPVFRRSPPSSPTVLRPLLTSPIISTHHENSRQKYKRDRRNSLPAIPSATFYPIHERDDEESMDSTRAVRFLTPRGSISKPIHGPRSPHPTALKRNASTHTLISLAWTGQLPSSIGSAHFTLSSVSSNFGSALPSASLPSAKKSTWSDEDENAPDSSNRRLRRESSSSLGRTRRWTLATAITNDEITDEMFVDEVESMRTKGRFWDPRRSFDSPPQSPQSPVSPSADSITKPTFPPRLSNGLPSLSDPLLSATWQTARRALLTCRELIRTERNYLASLFALVSDGTATPAPALMLTYVPALVQASEDLLHRMEANPSAQGVSEAFLEGESNLDSAFVAWCGVAGGFFGDDGSGPRDSNRGASSSDALAPIPLKRRMSTWVQGRRNSIRVHSTAELSRKNSAPPSTTRPRATRSLPSVRELAILPTQRVMRYALLFRDLLANIPANSPSYTSVKRALQAAITLAQKSDRAQGNAAFFRNQ